MKIVLPADQEYLLKSIIQSENWIIAPVEVVFYDVLDEILENSNEEYKVIVKDLISKLKTKEYIGIKDLVNQLISNADEE